MPEIPDEAVQAAMARRSDLLSDRPDPTALSEETLTRLMLEAAVPVLERAWRRKMAREILALDGADRLREAAGARHVGPYGDMRTSLRRLSRGEPLPDVMDLRGGSAVVS